MNFVKVKFRKSHHEFAYNAGDIGSITEENAAKLLESGHIILLPEDGSGDENTLPEDLPGRDKLFAVGFESVKSVKEAGESLSDVLNKTELKKVAAYLEGTVKG